jgi:hypothetical protein
MMVRERNVPNVARTRILFGSSSEEALLDADEIIPSDVKSMRATNLVGPKPLARLLFGVAWRDDVHKVEVVRATLIGAIRAVEEARLIESSFRLGSAMQFTRHAHVSNSTTEVFQSKDVREYDAPTRMWPRKVGG